LPVGRRALIASRAGQGQDHRNRTAIIQVDKLWSAGSPGLRETNDKIGEFVERKVTAEDQLRRIDIRARRRHGVAVDGSYHWRRDHCRRRHHDDRAADDALSVEAKVNPQDIDKLQIGQKTLLRLSAFSGAPRRN
jgi:HlyD family secretion protein